MRGPQFSNNRPEMMMLVLTRRRGETIEIACGEIIVEIVDIRGDKVRVGITAPKDIDINRGEIAQKMKLENFESAKQAVL